MTDAEVDYKRALSYVAIRKEYETSLGCVAAVADVVTRAEGDFGARLHSIGRLLTPYEADIVDIQLKSPGTQPQCITIVRSDKDRRGVEAESKLVLKTFLIEARGTTHGSVQLTRVPEWSKKVERLEFSSLDIATVQLVCSQIAMLAEMRP